MYNFSPTPYIYFTCFKFEKNICIRKFFMVKKKKIVKSAFTLSSEKAGQMREQCVSPRTSLSVKTGSSSARRNRKKNRSRGWISFLAGTAGQGHSSSSLGIGWGKLGEKSLPIPLRKRKLPASQSRVSIFSDVLSDLLLSCCQTIKRKNT